jgi:apolipoprotein D and lipocalin family protein
VSSPGLAVMPCEPAVAAVVDDRVWQKNRLPGRMIRLLLPLVLLAACAPEPPLRTVSDFVPERYLGTWHEIAAIPAWFQYQCASDTKAVYVSVSDPQEIGVENSCRRADGTLDTALGRARFTAPPADGRLEVTFLHFGDVWVWPVSGAYQVMALDSDYGWSLVGHPSRDYAWILARETRLDDATLVLLRERLVSEGYDPCRLILTADADPRRGRSLCALN